jgi:predicted phosphodiesterase
MKTKPTAEDLINAYDAEGSIDAAAIKLRINRKTFTKFWKELIGEIPPKKKCRDKVKDGFVKVALISDLHIGSKYEADKELADFIKYCRKQGIQHIVCAGDITDGFKMHEGMEYEQYLHSSDDYIDAVKDKYPKGFNHSYFIAGNHDESFRKKAGLDIGRRIAMERRDITYLGAGAGSVILPGNLHMAVYHGSGMCGLNRSLRLQKYALSLAQSPAQFPEAIIGGHCHQLNVTPNYMHTMLISLPGFQHPTPYLISKGLYPDVGGIIFTYEVQRGIPQRLNTEFILYEVRIPKHKV